MAKTPRQQLFLDLDELQRRFLNLSNRVKGSASYRPITDEELGVQFNELNQDINYCFDRFRETTDGEVDTSTNEVDHSAAYDAVDKAEALEH